MKTHRFRTNGFRIAWRPVGAAGLVLLVFLAGWLGAPEAARAAVISEVDKSNVLNVVSDAGDAIAITCESGQIKVNGSDPGSGAFACKDLAGIVVLGGPGDNAIDLSGLAIGDLQPGIPISADGLDGSDTLTGGPYGETLKGGIGDDTLTSGYGSDLLDGGEDGDLYLVNPDPAAGDLITASDSGAKGTDTLRLLGTKGSDSFTMDDINMTLGSATVPYDASIESNELYGQSGDDLFLLLCDRFTTALYGGPGSDTMTVREIEAATLLDGGEDGDGYEVDFGMLLAALTIGDTGSTGDDALTANGTPGNDSFVMDDAYLARDKETINFAPISLEKATILAGDGMDLFLLLCDRFTTEFYGGPGSDTMTVKEIEAATLLDGGEDGDGYEVDFGMLLAALTIGDTGSTGDDALTANGTPGGDGFVMDDAYLARDKETINFAPISLEKATILAGDGMDLFLLLCDRFTTEFYGGPGSDTMTVKEIEAASLLDGGEDGDAYQVDFGVLLAGLTIDDTGTAGADALAVKAPAVVSFGRPQALTWLITPSQVTFGAQGLAYGGSIEGLDFLGSAADETVQVEPSPATTMALDGGGHVLGDSLVVDAGGRPVATQPGVIKVAGLKPVSYKEFEKVEVINRLYVQYLPVVLRAP
jgi:hypothetical protein